MTELFNKCFINVVQNTVGEEAASCIADPSNSENDSYTVKRIIFEYDNHPSIKDTKANYKDPEIFNFSKASIEDKQNNKIIKS